MAGGQSGPCRAPRPQLHPSQTTALTPDYRGPQRVAHHCATCPHCRYWRGGSGGLGTGAAGHIHRNPGGLMQASFQRCGAPMPSARSLPRTHDSRTHPYSDCARARCGLTQAGCSCPPIVREGLSTLGRASRPPYVIAPARCRLLPVPLPVPSANSQPVLHHPWLQIAAPDHRRSRTIPLSRPPASFSGEPPV